MIKTILLSENMMYTDTKKTKIYVSVKLIYSSLRPKSKCMLFIYGSTTMNAIM